MSFNIPLITLHIVMISPAMKIPDAIISEIINTLRTVLSNKEIRYIEIIKFAFIAYQKKKSKILLKEIERDVLKNTFISLFIQN